RTARRPATVGACRRPARAESRRPAGSRTSTGAGGGGQAARAQTSLMDGREVVERVVGHVHPCTPAPAPGLRRAAAELGATGWADLAARHVTRRIHAHSLPYPPGGRYVDRLRRPTPGG